MSILDHDHMPPLGTVVRAKTTVVVSSGKLAGITTVTDILQAMAELLEARFDHGPTDAA